MADEDVGDISLLGTTWLVKAAATVQGVSGLFVVLGVLQLAGSVFFGGYEPLNVGKWALAALGAIAIVVGARLTKMRVGATVAAIVVALVLAPLAVAWLALCVSAGVYSLMHSAAAGVSCLAAVLVPLTIRDVRRAAAVRAKLAASGLDLGL
jgi:hypothetical protein